MQVLFYDYAHTLEELPKKCHRIPSLHDSAEGLVADYKILHEIMKRRELQDMIVQWSSCSLYGNVLYVLRRNRHFAVQVCQNQGA